MHYNIDEKCVFSGVYSCSMCYKESEVNKDEFFSQCTYCKMPMVWHLQIVLEDVLGL